MNAPERFAAAVQQLVAALLTVCRDPADALRTLMQLADFDFRPAHAPSPIGRARAAMHDTTHDLFRRSTVIALARAAAAYRPHSDEDAQRVQQQVSALLDAEMTRAADQGEDASFQALRALQAAVKQDLTARGAKQAAPQTVSMKAPLPALALAQRLYRDAARADELVRRADPIHPAFMPLTFKAAAQ